MLVKQFFTYGTLMEGERNFDKYLKEHVIDVKEAYIHGELYYLPEYDCPAIIEGDERVNGQLITFYNVDNTIAKIDELENDFGHDSKLTYDRVEVIADSFGQKIKTTAYVCKSLENIEHIKCDSKDFRLNQNRFN